ncbi:MAG: UDP-N-acetylglucosamine 1-carboxyvinyltransferase [Clostridium sp.]|uniref:UDP-N-acetylglucosamine 1-carboxyvinyltransferase n=2 Tax=Clostridium sp. TaxID=1506 RepID=UPI002FC766D5
MEKLLIEGGRKLVGKVKVSGAKNAAVAILPAAILADSGTCTIDNLPNIEDINCLEQIIGNLGATVERAPGTMKIDPSGIKSHLALRDEVKRMRASYYLIGALLSKFGKAEVVFPGGCNIGTRPIDQHIKGFEAMGATVTVEDGVIKAYTENGLRGANIYLDVVSVGATINIMLAATKAEGTTIIENAAKEPHIVDVANFLNSMGANVKGAGTDVIKIKGVDKIVASDYSVIPDQIEAGTYMIVGAITKGDVTVENVIPKHLESITAKLLEMGINVEEGEDSVRVTCEGRPKSINLKTLPYPGFPTDLQQPMSTLLAVSEGVSTINESIWEGRFRHIGELQKMGAIGEVDGKIAKITGVEGLTGAEVEATDLRAGAAMVVAGLVASGTTKVTNLVHVDRGYEHIEDKLTALGASIKRINE